MALESPRIAELRRRIESDPSSIAFAQLAEEYRRAGQYEAAEQCCRTGLARHPAYLSARVTLGRALIELNKLDEAEHELHQVLQAAPDNLAAIRGMAEILHRIGRFDEALDYYRRALALARHDPELEEIVERLNRELTPAAPPATPSESPVDFDQLLASLGIAEHAAPPSVEALLEESPQPSVVSPPSADSVPPVTAGPEEPVESPPVGPEPDWTVGPLPEFSAPIAAEEPVTPLPEAVASPEAVAPPEPVAPQLEAHERMILDELEAWLAAIKR